MAALGKAQWCEILDQALMEDFLTSITAEQIDSFLLNIEGLSKEEKDLIKRHETKTSKMEELVRWLRLRPSLEQEVRQGLDTILLPEQLDAVDKAINRVRAKEPQLEDDAQFREALRRLRPEITALSSFIIPHLKESGVYISEDKTKFCDMLMETAPTWRKRWLSYLEDVNFDLYCALRRSYDPFDHITLPEAKSNQCMMERADVDLPKLPALATQAEELRRERDAAVEETKKLLRQNYRMAIRAERQLGSLVASSKIALSNNWRTLANCHLYSQLLKKGEEEKEAKVAEIKRMRECIKKAEATVRTLSFDAQAHGRGASGEQKKVRDFRLADRLLENKQRGNDSRIPTRHDVEAEGACADEDEEFIDEEGVCEEAEGSCPGAEGADLKMAPRSHRSGGASGPRETRLQLRVADTITRRGIFNCSLCVPSPATNGGVRAAVAAELGVDAAEVKMERLEGNDTWEKKLSRLRDWPFIIIARNCDYCAESDSSWRVLTDDDKEFMVGDLDTSFLVISRSGDRQKTRCQVS